MADRCGTDAPRRPYENGIKTCRGSHVASPPGNDGGKTFISREKERKIMDKLDVVKKIQEIGVVAVVRGKTPEEAMMMSKFRSKVPSRPLNWLSRRRGAQQVIEALSKKYADNPDTSSSAPVRSSMPLRPASPSSTAPSSSYRRPGCRNNQALQPLSWPSCRGRRPSTASLRPWNTALTSSRSFGGNPGMKATKAPHPVPAADWLHAEQAALSENAALDRNTGSRCLCQRKPQALAIADETRTWP